MIIHYNPTVKITSIKIIGYNKALYPHDFKFQLETDPMAVPVDIMDPDDFYATDIAEFRNTAFIICIFKNLNERKEISAYMKQHNLNKCSFVHDTSFVNLNEATILPGSFVMQFCIILYHATIGEDCLITPYTLISHNATLGNGVNVCPSSIINGSVTIGDYSYIGSKTTFKDGVSIIANTYIGMSSTVSKDIELSGTYVGSPCRKVSDETVFDHFNFS